MRRFLALLVLALLVAGAFTRADFWQREAPLRGPFSPEIGLAYMVAPLKLPLPFPVLFTTPSDSSGDPDASRLLVFENGERLGRAHAPHDLIRTEGKGAYSHWNGGLRFSTRDGTNPNDPGKTYTVRYPVRVAGWVMWGLVALLVGLVLPAYVRAAWDRSAGRAPVRRILALPCGLMQEARLRVQGYALPARLAGWWATPAVVLWGVVFYLHALSVLPYMVMFSPDTGSYFAFSAMRTAGYPVLLKLMQTTVDNPHWLVYFQFIIALVAIAALTRSLEIVLRSSLTAFLVGAALVAKDGLLLLHIYIGPDSLFFSMLTLHLAFGLRLANRISPATLIACVLFWTLAYLLRPSALGIWPGVFVLVLSWLVAKRWKPAVALALLMGAALSVNGIAAKIVGAYYKVDNAVTADVAGTSLFATIGFILKPDTPVSLPTLRDALLPGLADIQREYETAEGWDARYRVINQHYNTVAYAVGLPVTQKWSQDTFGTAYTFQQIDRQLLQFCFEVIKAEPAAFAEITAIKMAWQFRQVMTASWRGWFSNTFENTRKNMERDRQARIYVERFHYSFTMPDDRVVLNPFGLKKFADKHRVILNSAVTLSALLLSLLWLAQIWRRPEPQGPALAGAFAAGALLSYCVVVALVQDPLHRYQESVVAYSLVSLATVIVLASRRTLFNRSARA